MCSASLPAETSIDVLNLSRRAYNCLRRAGIDMVQQVATMSDDELLAIQRLGPTVLSEIREKLTTYLDPDPPLDESLSPGPGPSQAPPERANPPTSPGFEVPDPTDAIVSRPLFPLIEPNVLAHSSRAPLDQIPLERLVLPDPIHRQLQDQGVRSVGELIRQAATASEQALLISEHMERYLTWLAEQDEAAWVDEVTGRDISPLYRTRLTGETLDALITGWLSGLRERQKEIIRWRYGLGGERVTLKKVGQRCGFTRERARQIQNQALSALGQAPHRERIAPLAALLVHLLKEAGGLLDMVQLEVILRHELAIGDVDPIGVIRLICKVDDRLRWVGKAKSVGLTIYPLSRVDGIQKQLTRVLNEHGRTLSVNKLLARFEDTRFYTRYKDELDDVFVIACLQAHRKIEIRNGRCALASWSGKRLDSMILALRELGGPSHYIAIAERTNDLLPREQRTLARNIHAHLHRRSDVFIRVGRGIFGLREWGLPDDGNLANAVYRVLAEAGRPLLLETITDRVLETWQARRFSVYVAIINDDRFRRTGPSVYGLVEWEQGPVSEWA
jgi:hypothetical protein